MTINVLRRKARGDTLEPSHDPLAIGEVERDVFSCPSCARPLAMGTHRCIGCGKLLILGVSARRAGFILINGLVLGVLIGGVITASFITATRGSTPVAGAGAVLVPASSPTPTPGPTATPGATEAPAPILVPTGMLALRQATGINARLAAAASRIQAARAVHPVDAPEIARALRAIAGDATYGADYTDSISTWTPAETLGSALATGYAAAIASSKDGLRAPIRDPRAYAAAADRMLVILADIAALDDAAQALIATAGAASTAGS